MQAIKTLDGFITEFGGVKNKIFHRKIYIKRDEDFSRKVENFIENHGNTDIYYCMYHYENNDIDNCKILGSPYLDFDGSIETDEEYEVIRNEVCLSVNYFKEYWKIPIDMIEIFFSGAKGFHVIIPFEILGLKPCSDLNVRNKMLARLVSKQCGCSHIDTGIYDRKRLFRIPGSINGKSGLHKVPLTYEQLTSFSLEEMKAWAAEPRESQVIAPRLIKESALHYVEIYRNTINKASKKKSMKKKEFVFPTKKKPLLPCVVEILKTGATKGQRNNTTVVLASSLMQSGIKRSEAEDILLDWNQSNEPPLKESEVCTTIASAYRGLVNGMCYGCTALKDLGYCVGDKCKITQK